MSTIIHRNGASKDKILASNVLMGTGNNKNDTVQKRIEELEAGGGGGGSTVVVTPILTQGVHIANIMVDNQVSEIYAPEGGGTGDVTDVLVDGVSVVNEQGEAIIIMPSDFNGATPQQAGSSGLVPAPTIADANKFLKGDGTWGEAGSVSEIIYVTPHVISLNEITDGSNNDVLRFLFYNGTNNNNVSFISTFNFEVDTTVDYVNEIFYDCALTAKIILDGIIKETIQEIHTDGSNTLTLSYLIQNLSIGNHVLAINFSVSGGSIS